MSVVRAFIALEIDPALRPHIHQVSSSLQEELPHLPLRWVPVENMHLTVKFLGDVSPANLKLIKEMLESEIRQHKRFEFGIGNCGAFPNEARPRVLWIGVEGPDELLQLHRRIENIVGRFGYERDKKSYTPHLTLARVSRNATPQEIKAIGECLRERKVGYLGAVRVNAVHLFRSDLMPEGAVYTKLLSVPLAE